MEVLIINFKWMVFNCILAVIPVFLGIFMSKTKTVPFKLIAGLFWLLFLPNTIYLLSDPINILGDMSKLTGIYLAIDSFFYLLLIPVGIISYVVSIELFLKAFFKFQERMFDLIMLMINLLLGFGIILGRIERVNSWEVLTDTQKVIESSFKILSSAQLMLYVVIWGAVAEIVYLILRRPVMKWVNSPKI